MPNARPCRTRRSSSSAGVLRQLVVLAEELLELVDDQQRPRHRQLRPALAVGGQVLHARLAEQLAAAGQLRVEPLQHAQAELAVAFDRDRPGVGQVVRRVRLELDALLEVDQVKLDLVRASTTSPGSSPSRAAASICPSRSCRRSARAGRRRCPGAASAAASRPSGRSGTRSSSVLLAVQNLLGVGRDRVERHLDALRLLGAPGRRCPGCRVSDVLAGRRVERQRELLEDLVLPDELGRRLLHEVDAVGFELVQVRAAAAAACAVSRTISV